ncbi:MAG: DNA mismatch repair endonuclease MutL [Treponema sp.]|nr:DNA mismatch repair endonuclease MutL [Treponema sp.]MCL2252044.1 DNA mismatch repair endonuclease MutL [Treponema sp.]
MTENNLHSKIKILPPEEARRIAAGEVIDRPSALVREFLDNAIDAKALNIEISVEEGGCKKVEIADDGEGMKREDLELCHLTHATSKIRGLDDLDTAVTLGFRGEALAAASAVSRLHIITSTDSREAWSLETGPGDSFPPSIEQTRRTRGTTVRALNLFESIPARKRFLKREGSEALLCRQAFIDKALAFNMINFRYLQDGKLKDFLPAVATKKERFAGALLQTGSSEKNFLHEINIRGDGFTATVVIGGPELYRSDRRQIFIFANGRRINDYSLVQAIEYGSQGWFPNGTHPIGAVFIEIDPSLADFNIHPAKREVRFRDPGAIHHAISGGVKNFFHSLFLKTSHTLKETGENSSHTDTFKERDLGFDQDRSSHSAVNHGEKKQGNTTGYQYTNNIDLTAVRGHFNKINSFTNEQPPVYGQMHKQDLRYAGRVFGLFILIEWGDKLYIIDQHAAHERILYNHFLEEEIPKQELLAPIPFYTESEDEDAFLESKREELSRLGIDIEKDKDGANKVCWRIDALPSDWRLSDTATIKEILELRTAGENMAKRWAATICCKAAIKDGDYPDDETAFALAKEALALPDPHCPHGRPIWTEISREALFKAVRRE